MIIDARTIPDNHIVETEICIIGAGAAGITLAREFIGQPFRVCLLESGDLELNLDTQSLYEGQNIGLPYFPLQTARLRYFGGSTNHWGGMCRPFNELDFEARDWIPYSGWPFRKSDLLPFYERAQAICQLNTAEWDLNFWKEQDEFPPLPLLGDRVISRVAQQVPTPSRRFGEIYRNEIVQAENITTYLNANVTEIETDETVKTVTNVRVACLSGNKFSVVAKQFVLAVGGIENPRLLLLSNKRQPSGLGNQHDLVGRFFMDHPRFMGGIFLPADLQLVAGFYNDHKVNDSTLQGYLGLSEEAQRSEQVVDVQVRFTLVYDESYTKVATSAGVTSLHYLQKSLRRMESPDDFGRHLYNVITDLGDVAVFAYDQVFGDNPPLDHIKLVTRIDPTPNPDSRITLAAERDQLGQNRVQLDWRLSPLDKYSVRRTLEIIGAELGRAELGRLQIVIDDADPTWPTDMAGGWHHMGTTRMSDDPKQGVVDRNCQVHGLSNLFIAGSSVFPTAGSGTPTLTLVALALRLADFLKERMK